MAAPTVQASNLAVSSITATEATLTGTRGNGFAAVFWVKRLSQPAAVPRDGLALTGDQSTWGGTRLGSEDWFCVGWAEGNINSVIQGLQPLTTYLVCVTECNGDPDGSPEHLVGPATNNPIAFTTGS